MNWWEIGGLPLWGEALGYLGAGVVGALGGYVFGRDRGIAEEASNVVERVEQEIQKRRNDLADRGRTTERRPEHDGLPPAVNRRIVVRGGTTSPADQPRDQL